MMFFPKCANFGTSSLGIAASGSTPAATTATEAWTGPSTTLNYKTLTTS